ncbi:MAG: LEPR-XLL domain-containing protein [Oscillospiraceae bacterium]|nr:LEPR-XLL domain-containing protein [Oscillospiraceae bacterium]
MERRLLLSGDPGDPHDPESAHAPSHHSESPPTDHSRGRRGGGDV